MVVRIRGESNSWDGEDFLRGVLSGWDGVDFDDAEGRAIADSETLRRVRDVLVRGAFRE